MVEGLVKERKMMIDKELLERQELINSKKELKKLRLDPNVVRYLNLLELENKEVKDKDAIIFDVMSRNCNFGDGCNIFLYMGGFRRRIGVCNDLLVPDECKCDYYLYRNIESGNYRNIDPENKKLFEENYDIIHLSWIHDFKKAFPLIQKLYFKELYTKEQFDEKKFIRKMINHTYVD